MTELQRHLLSKVNQALLEVGYPLEVQVPQQLFHEIVEAMEAEAIFNGRLFVAGFINGQIWFKGTKLICERG